ncbi:GNAT family N-acetyltransferase [Gemmata sp. JC673]|uniref:GNAT family N-acetyltransferase n=1 Tax=Gemmata algarum TaxID=2975278 RepID=A0ABU5EU70_9BACT|nr:GNAT family N-acetyltransferase [Gemmata algarum]MDY3558514.1 GNAT family N-acetyltransferase [Gemmata algarum]
MTTLPLVTLRPVVPADAEFLYRVYASTRYDELAPAGWPPERVESFLRMQFRTQDAHYREHFGRAAFDVIVCDDEPVGRFYVDHRADEIRVVDIALLPAFRGLGVGTRLLTGLLAEAAAANKPVRVHVEANNPAQRLYRRLGFVWTGTTGVYDLLERLPG